MSKKNIINNTFFDLLAFMTSFIFSFFRGFKLFLGKKELGKKINLFFDFLDFIFRKWSKYFWEKPSFYKLTSFFGDVLNFIFRK